QEDSSSSQRRRTDPQPLASTGGVANPKGVDRTTAKQDYITTGLERCDQLERRRLCCKVEQRRWWLVG
ncbi:hypothetical protein A2U01_0105999, partial [Trifolium medium]|nr:hypothetical protein [Trifolium medium]